MPTKRVYSKNADLWFDLTYTEGDVYNADLDILFDPTAPFYSGDGSGGEGGTTDQQARDAIDAITERQIATHTTALLAAGASETFTLILPRTFTILSITASAQSFTRGYLSTAARTADASRLPGVTPSDAVYYGLAFDLNLPDKGALSVPVNEDFSLNPQGELYMSVKNTGSSSAAITLTLEYLEREAV